MKPDDRQPQREANEEGGEAGPGEQRKQRVPAGPIPQRPDEPPIGNGATGGPAAFPPHN